jgi:hypothetical protein
VTPASAVSPDPDIERVISRLREGLAPKLGVAAVPPLPAILPGMSIPGGDLKEDLDTLHRMVDTYSIPLTSHRQVVGAALVFVKRVLRKMLKPVFMRQVAYNEANTRVVQTLASEIQRLATEVERLAAQRPGPGRPAERAHSR